MGRNRLLHASVLQHNVFSCGSSYSIERPTILGMLPPVEFVVEDGVVVETGGIVVILVLPVVLGDWDALTVVMVLVLLGNDVVVIVVIVVVVGLAVDLYS